MTTLAQDIDLQRSYERASGKLMDACDNCNKQLNVYSNIRITGGDFLDDRFNYTKDLCVQCAEQDCALYLKATELKWAKTVVDDLKKTCHQSLAKAETLKKTDRERPIK